MQQIIQTPEQQYYLTKLLGYNYEIRYKPGKNNASADAMSRNPTHQPSTNSPGTFIALTMLTFLILEDIKKAQISAPELQSVPISPPWSVEDGLYLYQEKIYIPNLSPLKESLMREFHNSVEGGHGGTQKTFLSLNANFYWTNMRRDVKAYIKQCAVCQQVKAINVNPYGLLQPLDIPKNIWEDISMDFITHLPTSQGYTCILVVVDRLSKAAHFGLLPTNYTASKVAFLLWEIVTKHHGIPKSFVSDRDAIFLSKIWTELFQLQGTTLKMSSSYHPQTDGLSEVVNRCLEQYLRCFVSEEPHQWHKFLGLAEWLYNTSYHSAIQQTPFEVVFGKKPPTLAQYMPGTAQVEAVDITLQTRDAKIKIEEFAQNIAISPIENEKSSR